VNLSLGEIKEHQEDRPAGLVLVQNLTLLKKFMEDTSALLN